MSFVSPLEIEQALTNCIERKHPVLITQKNDKDWQVCKTILTSSSLKKNITTGKRSLTYGEKNPSGEVGVNFRRGHYKLLFRSYLHDNTLLWPTRIMKIPRRAYDRRCPQDTITVRCWAVGYKQIDSQLEDISTGGMRVSTSHEFDAGSYTCSIDTDEPIIVDAILRSSESHNERKTLCFQFVGLEFDQQTASRLIKLTRTMINRAVWRQNNA